MEPEQGDEVRTITKAQLDDIGRCQSLHPSMSDIKSLPGYREHEDGTWSAKAKGEWGEAMTPFWRADSERVQCMNPNAAEPRESGRGASVGWTRAYAENFPGGKR